MWQKSNQFNICWRGLTLRHYRDTKWVNVARKNYVHVIAEGLTNSFHLAPICTHVCSSCLIKQQFYLHELRQWSTSVCPCAPWFCSAAFPHFPVSVRPFSYPCCSQERVSCIIPWLHLEPFSKWDKTVKARNFLKKSQCCKTHDKGSYGHYRATNWPRLCLTSFLNLHCVEFTSSFTTSWIRYVNEQYC